MTHITKAKTIIAATLTDAQAPCATSSFQASGVVLLHLIREQRPDLPVLFLDTLHHFPETLAYRDEMAARWGLNVITLRAEQPRPGLWLAENADACCRRHKVEPLMNALQPYDVWFTALRRDQSSSRAAVQEREPFRAGGGHTIRRVSPLAGWTMADVEEYAEDNGIPLLPLYDLGYTSIGCEPCTSVPVDAANPRSGRWGGLKLECGIHLQAV